MRNKSLIFPLLMLCLISSCGEVSSTSSPITTTSTSSQGSVTPTTTTPISGYKLEWVISEFIEVKVEGSTNLPNNITYENNELYFTAISTNENYIVENIYYNDVKVFEYEGVYKVEVNEDAKIEVIASKKIKELVINKNPNKLVYNVGDHFDPTGVEVSCVYQDNTTKIIPLNSMSEDGYYYYPLTFEGGESSVQVYYKNKVVDIKLEKSVEYIVSLDPNGGTFKDAYLNKLSSMNLKNYAVSSSGVITFNFYNDLNEDVLLPTSDDVEREGYQLISLGTDVKVVNNQTKKSVYLICEWELALVKIESVSLLKENNTPYLIINGKYNSVESVYLYLYEGKSKISLVGDTYTKSESNEFNVKFDLTKLSDKGSKYVGKWMDIRFNTIVAGKEESMEIDLVNNPEIQVDLTQNIYTSNNCYFFATYSNKLKVYFIDAPYTYIVGFDSDDAHDYVIFDGTISEAYKNKTIQISWWVGKEDIFRTTTVNENGTFSIKIEMDEFPKNTNTYAHITILDGESVMFGGTNVNFMQSACLTSLPSNTPSGSSIKNCVSYVGNKATYYIGGNGTGLMLFAI